MSYKVIKKVKPVECKPTKINLKEALSTKKVHNYYFELEKFILPKYKYKYEKQVYLETQSHFLLKTEPVICFLISSTSNMHLIFVNY